MKKLTISNTGKAPIGFKALKLQPGDTEVDAEQWTEAKGNVVIKAHLESGRLVEGGKQGKKAEPATAKTTEKVTEPVTAKLSKPEIEKIIVKFVKLPETEAIDSVKAAESLEVLYAVFEGEKREKVKEALAKRIEELEKKS